MIKASPPSSQPWIYRLWVDGMFILLPAFLATAMVFLFPEFFRGANQMPPWAWLVFIVGIDVSHVYSTLYRTYFDREEFNRYRRPLVLIPLIAWIVGIGLHWVDPMLFWRLLAYLAVYHFVRQQYGFFSIYARHEIRQKWERRIDGFAIYMATIYPLIYWHTHLPRNFFWFVPGDFVGLPFQWIHALAAGVYAVALGTYITKEVRRTIQTGQFNWPKNLILLGTVLSWFCGIVLVNGDLAFTATNVVAHGIPYMALIWIYGRKKTDRNANSSGWIQQVFRVGALPLFIGLLLLFAYLEEGLWDGLVWHEHQGLFPWTADFPLLQESWVMAVVVSLLTLPQVTHYVIDGFIWRVRKPDSELQKNVFQEIR